MAWFYRNCLTDTCNCNRGGDCECLCTSIAAYAHKCCQQGVTIHWRSPSVCREYTHMHMHITHISFITVLFCLLPFIYVIILTFGTFFFVMENFMGILPLSAYDCEYYNQGAYERGPSLLLLRVDVLVFPQSL